MQDNSNITHEQQRPPLRHLTRPLDSREYGICSHYHPFPGLDPRFGTPAISTRASQHESIVGHGATRTKCSTQTSVMSPSHSCITETWAFDFDSSPTSLVRRAREEGNEPVSPKTTTNTSLSAPTAAAAQTRSWRLDHIGAQAFDFTTSSVKRKRHESHVAISPKTTSVPQRQRAIYHLPVFLEEELADLSTALVNRDVGSDEVGADEDAEYDVDDEVTPTQESFAKFQYYGGGNYFLPTQSKVGKPEFGSMERAEKEKFKRNAWSPAMLTPVVENFEDEIL